MSLKKRKPPKLSENATDKFIKRTKENEDNFQKKIRELIKKQKSTDK